MDKEAKEIVDYSVESSIAPSVQRILADAFQQIIRVRYNSGVGTKIVRATTGKCCELCTEIAGEYIVGIDNIDNAHGTGVSVFFRHRKCDCLVTYHSEEGIQDVHTKYLYSEEEYQKRLEMYSYSDIINKAFHGGANWTGGRYIGREVPLTNSVKKPDIFIRGCEDITSVILQYAEPNNSPVNDILSIIQDRVFYRYDGKNVQLQYTDYEKHVAEILQKKLGVEVRMVPKIHGKYKNVNTPDYLINGARFDLKEFEEYSDKKYYNAVHSKKKVRQADNHIIDITNCSNPDGEKIINQIVEGYNNYGLRHIKTTIVIKRGEIIRIFIRK